LVIWCVRNSKNAEETYFSEKELKARREYHIVIKSQWDEACDMHQVSLYVNGFDDLRTTIKFFTPFENSQILLG
jgi:hypothetical protein